MVHTRRGAGVFNENQMAVNNTCYSNYCTLSSFSCLKFAIQPLVFARVALLILRSMRKFLVFDQEKSDMLSAYRPMWRDYWTSES